ncbi:MAG TPA: hypothetical protein VHX14_15645 [Thermoanaerobaculia bacterium]|jgi:hypothetical protein|nr:hypothetical protein [Thermoanaerobaculia bacterium]
MLENTQTPKQPAAEAGTTQALPPEDVVTQLRVLLQQIGEVTPLTKQQRTALRAHAALPNGVVQASINVLGASASVQQALGQPADDVRQLAEDANRWTAVEDELRSMLKGIAGANLIRRQRVGLVSVQAYVISQQLARDPRNASLLPHVQEIKRLRSLVRRKKPATPAPQQPPAPAPPQHVDS